jgi:hypothetical protein
VQSGNKTDSVTKPVFYTQFRLFKDQEEVPVVLQGHGTQQLASTVRYLDIQVSNIDGVQEYKTVQDLMH